MDITTSKRGRPVARRQCDNLNRLREFRERAGLSQRELANKLGVTQAAISFAENTGRKISEEIWQKAADFFETDLLTLRGWKKIYREV